MRNLRTGSVVRVPAEVTGTPASDGVKSPSLNRSGRFLAFGGGLNVYVYDLQTGDLKRLSDNGGGGSPSLSADGRWLAFVSSSSTLVKGDTNGVADVFVGQARPLR